MGYYTYITGDLMIHPPIDEGKFADFTGDDSYFKFTLVEGDEDVQLVKGEIVVVGQNTGHTDVELTFDESVKAYDFNVHVERLVDRAKQLGHTVNGAFYGDGEESEDFWRIGVDDNKISSESGTITYPSERYAEISGRAVLRGHGNVIPRPDGKRRTCLDTCPDCADERLFLIKLLYGGP